MSEWIEWNGGECPVGFGQRIDIIFRNGKEVFNTTPTSYKWVHTPGVWHGMDVVAYRLCEPQQKEPEAIATVDETLKEREERYGAFSGHAKIAQGLKDVMRATEGWNRLTEYQRESLDMIQHKIARILNGDPTYTDNWHDIAGYARLVETELKEREQ